MMTLKTSSRFIDYVSKDFRTSVYLDWTFTPNGVNPLYEEYQADHLG